jgi:hypothetical protein
VNEYKTPRLAARAPDAIHLDTTDLRVLDLLQRDASLTNQALAERAHVSPATCHSQAATSASPLVNTTSSTCWLRTWVDT